MHSLSTALKLLQDAPEFVSGDKQLAMLTADLHHAPDPLLIRAVDTVLLARHQSVIPLPVTRTSGLGGDPSQ